MEISLRLPILSDAETMLVWENNPVNWEVSDNDSPYILEDMIDLINSFNDLHLPPQVRFIICANELLLGAVDIFEINYENKSGAIGILIAEDEFRRMGFASKALELVELEAQKMGIDRLYASIHLENTKSRKLFEKMGYLISSNQTDRRKIDSINVEKWVKKEL